MADEVADPTRDVIVAVKAVLAPLKKKKGSRQFALKYMY